MTETWKDKVGNIQRIGDIETTVLDNGPSCESRIARVNIGSRFRHKVVIDRCLDIVGASDNQRSLAWLSHGSLIVPQPDANNGLEWLYSFPGGLMTTYGLSRIGDPELDETEIRWLHDRITNMPTTLESIIRPDTASGRMDMSITATVIESRVFGPHLALRRTITSTLGESTITIHEEVTNHGNTSCPHMILYHCNFGWSLVDEGADIVYKGTCRSRGIDSDNDIFNEKHDYRKYPMSLQIHKGLGQACGFIDIKTDAEGISHVALINTRSNLVLTLTYIRQQFPALTNWQLWGQGEYVCALELGANFPID